jgi:hypothetical protein
MQSRLAEHTLTLGRCPGSGRSRGQRQERYGVLQSGAERAGAHAARLGLWPWIEAAGRRLHRNMLVIALANKLARIAWAVLARGHAYQPRSASHVV